MSQSIPLEDSFSGDDETATNATVSDTDNVTTSDQAKPVADITGHVVAIVRASKIPPRDIVQINITLRPPGWSITRMYHDANGNIVLDANDMPLVVNMAPIDAVLDLKQFTGTQ